MFKNMESKGINPIVHSPVTRALLIYFLPIFLGSIFQQSYNVVDAIIIGRYAGTAALGAIDATGSTQRLLINFVIGLAAGGSVLVARYVGAEKNDEVVQTVRAILSFSLIGSFVLILLGTSFTPFFARAMRVPPDIFDKTVLYSRILFIGSPFLVFYNTGSGIIKAMGDAQSPFYYLLVGGLTNIVLDLIFVAAMGMGVVGAGLGTVLAQALSCLLVLKKVNRYRKELEETTSNSILDTTRILEMLAIGLPIGMQSVLYSLSNMFMQAGVNGFGTIAIAAWSICGKMDFLIWTLVDTLAIAVTTFVAQNDGAGRPERIQQTLISGFVIAHLCVASIAALLYFYGRPISSWFIHDELVIDSAAAMMRLLAPFYVLYIGSELLVGSLRGLGDTLRPMVITLLGTCGLRIFWVVLVLPRYQTIETALYGYPISWAATSAGMVAYYFWKKNFVLTKANVRRR